MKKYSKFLSIGIIAVLAASCTDYNDNFKGLDELSEPENIAKYEYTLTDTDISTIVSALNANKNKEDSVTAKRLAADKMFSADVSAEKLIPYALNKLFYAADPGSSAMVTYKYNESRSPELTQLSTATYVITDADYKLIWGDSFVPSFTPAKSPSKSIPIILDKLYEGEEGMVKNVEYFYSAEEPVSSTVEKVNMLEDFNGHAAGTGVLVKLDGWINEDTEGSIGWQCRTFSSNNYAQVSANGSKAVNDVWLITKKIDLSTLAKPELSFDVCVGYYNANCLTVLISEDFDGTEANISKATWKDVTSSFAIPQAPASGYGTFASAGSYNMSSYAGKKVYVAFRYQADDTSTPKKTTTYQLDNIKVFEEEIGLTVEETEKQYDAYMFVADKWQQVNNKTILVLQPADYTAMGLTYMTTAQAPNYLPVWLKAKYPYAQEGDERTVVYKTSKTNNYANTVSFNNGNWEVNSTIVEKTSQFLYSNQVRWFFDPTLYVTMKVGKTETDDYMMIVNYIKTSTIAQQNPNIVNSYGDTEYYYGANANYGNITYREADRAKDPAYSALTDEAEKLAFKDARTIEGLRVYLNLKFPTATPEVNGEKVFAYVTTIIYDGVVNYNYTYKYQRVATADKWEYIDRVLNR